MKNNDRRIEVNGGWSAISIKADGQDPNRRLIAVSTAGDRAGWSRTWVLRSVPTRRGVARIEHEPEGIVRGQFVSPHQTRNQGASFLNLRTGNNTRSCMMRTNNLPAVDLSFFHENHVLLGFSSARSVFRIHLALCFLTPLKNCSINAGSNAVVPYAPLFSGFNSVGKYQLTLVYTKRPTGSSRLDSSIESPVSTRPETKFGNDHPSCGRPDPSSGFWRYWFSNDTALVTALLVNFGWIFAWGALKFDAPP